MFLPRRITVTCHSPIRNQRRPIDAQAFDPWIALASHPDDPRMGDMAPSSAKSSPVVLIQWSSKAQQQPELIDNVTALMRSHNLILLPSPQRSTTIISASQEELENQAEFDHLIKPRSVAGPSSVEKIMDFYTVEKRVGFCSPSSDFSTEKQTKGKRTRGKGTKGLFTIHERQQLLLGIFERISVSNARLLELLSENPMKRDSSTNLRYLLQSHGWVDALLLLHFNDEKVKIQRRVWYPFTRMVPPVEDINTYYGPEIAYCEFRRLAQPRKFRRLEQPRKPKTSKRIFCLPCLKTSHSRGF